MRRTGCPTDVRMGGLSNFWICLGDQAGAEPIIAVGVNVNP